MNPFYTGLIVYLLAHILGIYLYIKDKCDRDAYFTFGTVIIALLLGWAMTLVIVSEAVGLFIGHCFYKVNMVRFYCKKSPRKSPQ